MIPWLCEKKIDWTDVQTRLHDSIETNQFTNNGPAVKSLEKLITTLFHVPADKAVVVACNGACALHALVSAINIQRSKIHRYATQAYTFPSSVQGSLQGSLVVDIDEEGALDLDKVNPDEVDGIVVTTVLGNIPNVSKYTSWTQEHKKFLLFDHAATSCSLYIDKDGNIINPILCGTGCIVSLHHTKPIGFGEGGFVIVDREYEPSLRKIINFGYDMVKCDIQWLPQGSNFKMSDIAAAFCSSYLVSTFHNMVRRHGLLYQSFLNRLNVAGFIDAGVTMYPTYQREKCTPFVSCLAVLFPFALTVEEFMDVCPGVTTRKYYKPLDNDERQAPVAHLFYSRILCFPCHLDMDFASLDVIIQGIRDVFAQRNLHVLPHDTTKISS